jgi:hypothetical protein
MASGISSSVETDCDVTGSEIRSLKQASPEVCAATCEAEASCRGWSFISGWNKCSLKSTIKSKTKVRMYSGRVDRSKSPAMISLEGWQKDESGKDFRRVAPVTRAEDCSNECLKDQRCLAFVFIDGYQVCWLKKSIGKFSDKVFTCGQKNEK